MLRAVDVFLATHAGCEVAARPHVD
jgi:hypothetical protein